MTRLMDVLNYKAKQGVKIYILIYNEFSIALSINSAHTQNIFNKLNENIKITRYPSLETILWSNHEKLVIIDQVIAYVGGLDLCWGRYDNNQHSIYEPINPENIYEFPFIDYSNIRIKDFSKVEKYYIESVSREQSTRLPWHDIHSRIIGIAVANISKHFKQRWNHANSENNHLRVLSSIHNDSFIQSNQYNFEKEFTTINALNTNNHLQYELFLNTNKEDNFISFNENDNEMKNYDFSETKTNLTNSSKDAINEIYKKYFTEDIPPSNVEIIRSASKWSAGIDKPEHSILNSYYNLIKKAKHYIYIENQFFISRSWNDDEREYNDNCINDIVKNKIAYYIRKRIEKAYKKNKKFKVYILIPLLPGFDGNPQDSETIKIILKHTYAGINRNYGLSMIEQLEKIMGNKWKNYIGFFSLRNHALINDVPKTEIIYIHSKLMIIDDKTVLIGSANINDRSMLGDRDSELAVIINEKQELANIKTGIKFIMNGKENYNASNFAAELRKNLMAEHLGINPNDPILNDAVSDKLFSLFLIRAKNNTKIYHDIFACYPDDSFLSFRSLKDSEKIKKSEKAEDLLDKYNQLKDKIVGHIVEFPLLFLKNEDLSTSWISREKYIPEINFT